MKKFLLVFLILISSQALGQKLVRKELTNPESKRFLIDADKCFRVNLETHRSNAIIVNATIDGEYRKDVLVSVQEEGSNVTISADFQPNFINPNDKLSAHKVLSISMEIKLPENIDAHVYGTNANISIAGSYKSLKVDLADGNCTLNKVGEWAAVKTQSGAIYLNAASGTVHTISQYGQVHKNKIPQGNNVYNLHSVEGDIYILKTE